MSRRPFKVAITTGDPDGIGTEVCAKSVGAARLPGPVHYYFFRSSLCPPSHLIELDRHIYRKEVSSLKEALADSLTNDSVLFDIQQDSNPIYWVKEAALACSAKKLDAIVTGPLSKPLIHDSGLGVLGHTGLFRQLFPDTPMFMGFIGKFFNVVLVTDHIPLVQVQKTITSELILSAVLKCHELQKTLPTSLSSLPIGVLGLNPHAGDEGLIGSFENDFLKPLLRQLQKNSVPIVGPLVPDVAFQPGHSNKYSVLLCLYHDQGLIPFKMAHGQDSGAHVTLGLPFIRTSVDHGTAKDIFNKNIANANSMTDALKTAHTLHINRLPLVK